MKLSIQQIESNLLQGQKRFGEYTINIQSTRYDQYFAEITSPKCNFVIANYHPQSGLNCWSDNSFTGTLSEIVHRTACFLSNELSTLNKIEKNELPHK